jgi:hypothetical protein
MNFAALLVKLQRSPRFGIFSSSEGIAWPFFSVKSAKQGRKNKVIQLILFQLWFG